MKNQKYRNVAYALVPLLLFAATRPVYAEDKEAIQAAGDVIQILLPAAGISAALYMDDKEGQIQWLQSLATQIGTVGTIKFVVDKTRPNAGKNSFPSGHTAASFMGASFMQRRYGWEWGVPAYLAAGFVGYSRILTDKHDIYDVLGGATVGVVSTYIWTTPYVVGDTTVMLTPIYEDDRFGLNFHFGEKPDNYRLTNGPFALNIFEEEEESKPVQYVSLGTDPTEPISKLVLQANFLDQTGNLRHSGSEITGYVFDARVDYAFADQHMVGLDAALVINNNEMFDATGFGDLQLNYMYRFYQDDDYQWYEPYAASAGIDTLLPTGSLNEGTGNGVWLLHPKITAAWHFWRGLRMYTTLSYYGSVYEQSGADSVSVLAIEPMIEWRFDDSGFYFFWQPEFLIDFDNPDTANHRFEVGIPLNDEWVLFGAYSLIGNELWTPNPPPTDRPRYYDDIATIGARWFF